MAEENREVTGEEGGRRNACRREKTQGKLDKKLDKKAAVRAAPGRNTGCSLSRQPCEVYNGKPQAVSGCRMIGGMVPHRLSIL